MMIIGSNSKPMSVTVEFEKDGIVTRDVIDTSESGEILGWPNTDNIKRILQEKYKGSTIRNVKIKDWHYLFL